MSAILLTDFIKRLELLNCCLLAAIVSGQYLPSNPPKLVSAFCFLQMKRVWQFKSKGQALATHAMHI